MESGWVSWKGQRVRQPSKHVPSPDGHATEGWCPILDGGQLPVSRPQTLSQGRQDRLRGALGGECPLRRAAKAPGRGSGLSGHLLPGQQEENPGGQEDREDSLSWPEQSQPKVAQGIGQSHPQERPVGSTRGTYSPPRDITAPTGSKIHRHGAAQAPRSHECSAPGMEGHRRPPKRCRCCPEGSSSLC